MKGCFRISDIFAILSSNTIRYSKKTVILTRVILSKYIVLEVFLVMLRNIIEIEQYVISEVSRIHVDTDALSLSDLEKATVLIEDKRFFLHCGFDIVAIIRSGILNIFVKQKSGASTIEQQLIRTITGYKEKRISRKIKEIFLAYRLSKQFSKIHILRSYLKIAYMGTGISGVDEASSVIFNKRLDELNLDESCHISSLLKYPRPSNYCGRWGVRVNSRTNYSIKRLKRFRKSVFFPDLNYRHIGK